VPQPATPDVFVSDTCSVCIEGLFDVCQNDTDKTKQDYAVFTYDLISAALGNCAENVEQ
jgi:hypothetical protein